MGSTTRELWAEQDARHPGDRQRLFCALNASVEARRVLYPGSYVDLTPSFRWPSVTYVDKDRRAARFFGDEAGVASIIAENRQDDTTPQVIFIAGDYTADLGLESEDYDLLISLYAGFVSEHCTRFLRVGGSLLVNPSHGDAAMASIDDRYQLAGVLASRAGEYTVRTDNLDSYLIPKKAVTVTPDLLHQTGRGIAYTKSPFAYLFTRVH